MKRILILISGLSLITSCAREISGNTYTAGAVGEISTTLPGTVRSVRLVTVEEGDRLEDNGAGIIGGGILGGVVGNFMGRGNALPTVAGAATGAVVGSMAERRLSRQEGIEYVIELDQGGFVTVVQGSSPGLNPLSRVFVIVGQYGRSRVIPQ